MICRLVCVMLAWASLAPAQVPGNPARKEPAVFLGPMVYAAVDRTPPPSQFIPLPSPGVVEIGRLTEPERAQIGPAAGKQRIGVHRALPNGALDAGNWTALADGSQLWRVAIRSQQATGLRVEFSNFSVGAGKVWVHSGLSIDGPYTGRGPYGNGEFWSATVEGDSAVIEYQREYQSEPGASNLSPPFHIHRIAHQAAHALPPPIVDPASPCNLDLNCYPDWLNTGQSVADILYEETFGPDQGSFQCSGSLLATRDNSYIPYLLTSGLCIHDEAAARSLQTFWGYNSPGAASVSPPIKER